MHEFFSTFLVFIPTPLGINSGSAGDSDFLRDDVNFE